MAVERFDFQCGSVKAKHALVWNEKVSGKRPLLLVMPNWLGVTDIAIERARKMAGDKYVAFVGCMYGEGKTCSGPPTSQEWMMAVRSDRVEGRKRVNAASPEVKPRPGDDDGQRLCEHLAEPLVFCLEWLTMTAAIGGNWQNSFRPSCGQTVHTLFLARWPSGRHATTPFTGAP